MADDEENHSDAEEGSKLRNQVNNLQRMVDASLVREENINKKLEEMTLLMNKLGDQINIIQEEHDTNKQLGTVGAFINSLTGRKRVDVMGKICKLMEDVKTLQDDYDTGRKNGEAFIKDMKDRADFSHKLREDVNTLQDDYVTGRKREAALGKEIREANGKSIKKKSW